MPRPRLKLTARLDTLAHAVTVKAAFETQLAGKTLFDSSVAVGTDEAGRPALTVDLQCGLADRETLRTWLRDQAETHPVVKTWIQAVQLSWHACSHLDGTIKDCRTTDYAQWNKGVL